MSVDATVVPPEYVCPISLELMTDPVTITTGHTYERSSIQRWFEGGKATCPQSRQKVVTTVMIPNLTLKDCIRDWQLRTGYQKNDTNNPRLLTDINARYLLRKISVQSESLQSLKTIRETAEADDRNRKLLYESEALSLLWSVLSRSQHYTAQCTEALGAIAALSSNEEVKRKLPELGVPHFTSLSWFLNYGSLDAKVSVSRILECIVADDDYLLQLGAVEGLVPGLVNLLQQQLAPIYIKSSLICLHAISLPKKNRPLAIQAGAVARLLSILPHATKEVAEGVLAILALMSDHSAGQSALCENSLSPSALVESLVNFGDSANESAVTVLHSILMSKLDSQLHIDAVEKGIIAKLLLVLQIRETNSETKGKARELLKYLQGSSAVGPSVQTIN